MRLRTATGLLLFGLAVHIHHLHGPPLDYATVALAAFASWVGVPGPGEPVLIAAGVLAARHKLDLGELLVVAFLAAAAGGVLGWVIGMKAGRAVMLRRGPLLRLRQKAIERGEEVFGRYPALAVLLTTSWIAGIHRVRTPVYMLWNAVGAVIWTLGIGLGAYFAGPPVVDFVNDAGWIPAIGVVLMVILGAGLELVRRRRRPGPS
jgi:membrane protein DedA with SNARE-associated domain